jgi:signal transduction histidine kinase
LSYALVVGVGALTMLVVGTVVTRTVYDHRLGGFGLGGQGRGPGRGVQAEPVSEAELRTALDESLLPALLAGAAAALVAAALVAWFVGRRLLRPLDQVRDATRRMAAGDYEVEVPVPAEAELASLAEDVNELGAHLATTEQRRTQLLAEVTHELRTPITLIRGRMESLIDGVVEPSDEVFVGVAGEAARLQRLVDDLSLLSRADEGSLTISAAPVDLADLVTSVVERLRPQFDHERVRLVVEHDPGEHVVVLGDSDRLTQVVTNLLGNALGHTPSGGVVTVCVRREDVFGRVEVADTGSGIPVGELDRVFERFYRLPDPTAHGRPGRGLGLSIARSLARAHGGDVTAVSHGPGTGATFVVTIPLV